MIRAWFIFSLFIAVFASSCTNQSFVRAGKTDVFFQNPPTAVDILIVIDNSCSMADEQLKLSAGFDSFVEFFDVADVDYHIGVTTTDMTIERGRLVGNTRVITRDTSNAGQIFGQNVQVGTDGDPIEKGLIAAFSALTEPLISNENAGFMRDDALLSIIFVSDEEDSSLGPTSQYINEFRDLKGQRRRDAVNVSALIGINTATGEPADCQSVDGQAFAGWRYWDAAEQTNGVSRSICENDFSLIVSEMGLASSRLRDRFALSGPPDMDTLSVTMYIPGSPEANGDGVVVPQAGLEGGLYSWTIETDDEGINWLVFAELAALPPVDTRIVVRYELG